MMREADHSTIPGLAPRDPEISCRKTWIVGLSPAEALLAHDRRTLWPAGGTSRAMTE